MLHPAVSRHEEVQRLDLGNHVFLPTANDAAAFPKSPGTLALSDEPCQRGLLEFPDAAESAGDRGRLSHV